MYLGTADLIEYLSMLSFSLKYSTYLFRFHKVTFPNDIKQFGTTNQVPRTKMSCSEYFKQHQVDQLLHKFLYNKLFYKNDHSVYNIHSFE